MEILNWRGVIIPKIFSAPYRQNSASDPKSFGGARTCLRSSITVPSLVGLRFHPPPWQPQTLSFFCSSVSLSFRRAFERQRLCAGFCNEGIRVYTETILMPLDRERSVVVHPRSTFSDWCQLATILNAESKKRQKLFFFAATGRQNKAIETKFHISLYTVGLL